MPRALPTNSSDLTSKGRHLVSPKTLMRPCVVMARWFGLTTVHSKATGSTDKLAVLAFSRPQPPALRLIRDFGNMTEWLTCAFSVRTISKVRSKLKCSKKKNNSIGVNHQSNFKMERVLRFGAMAATTMGSLLAGLRPALDATIGPMAVDMLVNGPTTRCVVMAPFNGPMAAISKVHSRAEWCTDSANTPG